MFDPRQFLKFANDSDGRRWIMIKQQVQTGCLIACCMTVYMNRFPTAKFDYLTQLALAWRNGIETWHFYYATLPDLFVCVKVLKFMGIAAVKHKGPPKGVAQAPSYPIICSLQAMKPDPSRPGQSIPIPGEGHGIVVAGKTSRGGLVCLDPRSASLVEIAETDLPAINLGQGTAPYEFTGNYVVVLPSASRTAHGAGPLKPPSQPKRR